ncbi:MAP kinase-interacting serine/threonine-protein kinase 1 isoform X2 [Hydra vulgaris]|uniref:MAP kinase-interacting serine/threonine-protein kinase 1 isoform X2 n=1 Tax=Hydra vulgaris TaxID=6087 RepID=A0ABM4C7G2_HYDVU
MENGWHFPTSYEDWIKNGVEEVAESGEIENVLFADAHQPIMPKEIVTTKKKKKKLSQPVRVETFHDKYTLSSEVLGRGANSLVSLAKEKCSSRDFAVKIIEKYDGYDRRSVLTEIDLLHYLSDCPNILHLYDSYEDESRFYLVFERMEGGPLLSHIEKKGVFTEREASLVVQDIATALRFLHNKGISHRDLKPDNILCINKDEIVPAVICDFNLASGISIIDESVTTPELYTPVGSAEYMAPEVVDAFVSEAAYDKKCDIWSLGVILYIMLSGRAPFQGSCGEMCDWERGGSCKNCKFLLWHSILDGDYSFSSEEWKSISMEAKDLISHLLVKDSSKRFSVEDVLAHPWLEEASNNELNTPNVLASSSYTYRLSCMASEAVAYHRHIVSERKSDKQENHTRWSTPPKFGLSPLGNSNLAKRRSIKNKLKLVTPFTIDDSQNDTPVASPVVESLFERALQLNTSNDKKSDCFKIENQMANFHQTLMDISKRNGSRENFATYQWSAANDDGY